MLLRLLGPESLNIGYLDPLGAPVDLFTLRPLLPVAEISRAFGWSPGRTLVEATQVRAVGLM